MKKFIDQSLKSLIKPDQCLLCDVQLTQPSVAKSHYDSKRHKNKVKLFQQEMKDRIVSIQQPNLQIPLVKVEPLKLKCETCNMTFKSQEKAQKHYSSDLHKNFRNWYCEICEIITMSNEQLWNHMKGASHQNKIKELGLPQIDVQSSPFCNNLPKYLKDRMLMDNCLVCRDSFSTVKQAVAHYIGIKHDLAVRKVRKETEEQTKKLATIQQKKLQVVSQTLVQDQAENTASYCYLCKKMLASRALKVQHLQEFPHSDVAQLKSGLIKQGILKEFWAICPMGVKCNICDTGFISGSDNFNGHLNSNRHLLAYSDWLSSMSYVPPSVKAVLKTEAKFFYCQICDKDLDGTREAERHYTGLSHNKKKNEAYCDICEIQLAAPSLMSLHNTTTLHLSNLKKLKKKLQTKENTSGTSQTEINYSNSSSIEQCAKSESESENLLNSLGLIPCIGATVKRQKESTSHIPELKPIKKTDTTEAFYIKANSMSEQWAKPTSEADILLETVSVTPGIGDTVKLKPVKKTGSTKTEDYFKTTKTIPEKTVCPKETKNLKQQVFNQLELIIQKLYYSKTVPYEVSLDYLKQINKEVNELSRKYASASKENVTNTLLKDEAGGSNSNFVGGNDGQHCSFYVDNHLPDHMNTGNVEYIDYYAKDNLLQKAEPVIDNEAPLENVNVADESLYQENVGLSSTGDEISTNVTKSDEVISVPASFSDKVFGFEVELSEDANVDSIEVKDISELLSQIVERKLELEGMYPNELVVEKEVLNEIEVFLRSIDSGSVPLEETLKCLEKFNEELEANDFLKEETVFSPYEEKLQCLEKVVEESESTNIREEIDGNGVNFQKIDEETPNYTYSVEDLLDLRTKETFFNVSSERKEMLMERGLWRRGRVKHKLTPADDCSASVYKYYSGTNNFEPFMNFSEIYLQGSIEYFRKSDDGKSEKSDQETSGEELLNLRTEDTFANATLGQEVLTERTNHNLTSADDCPVIVYHYYSDTSNFDQFIDF